LCFKDLLTLRLDILLTATELSVIEEISRIQVFKLWLITLGIYILQYLMLSAKEIACFSIACEICSQANLVSWQVGISPGKFASILETNLNWRVGVPIVHCVSLFTLHTCTYSSICSYYMTIFLIIKNEYN
jgi:hypothetical protein